MPLLDHIACGDRVETTMVVRREPGVVIRKGRQATVMTAEPDLVTIVLDDPHQRIDWPGPYVALAQRQLIRVTKKGSGNESSV